MLLADSSKVGMLVNGALMGLFWAGVTADLELNYVDDACPDHQIPDLQLLASFSIVACLTVIRILSPFSCE